MVFAGHGHATSGRLAGLMTASRDELLELIEEMPDDQVAELLADARRLADSKPKRNWLPPKFVGMIKDGPRRFVAGVRRFRSGAGFR